MPQVTLISLTEDGSARLASECLNIIDDVSKRNWLCHPLDGDNEPCHRRVRARQGLILSVSATQRATGFALMLALLR